MKKVLVLGLAGFAGMAVLGYLLPDGPPARARGERRAADFGEKWPLTADVGFLKCDPRRRDAAIITVNGTDYALNGVANSLGYPYVPTKRDLSDPALNKLGAVVMMSTDALREEAAELCK